MKVLTHQNGFQAKAMQRPVSPLHARASSRYDLSVTLATLKLCLRRVASHAARRKLVLTKKHKHTIIPPAIQVSHATDSIDSRAWPQETEANKIPLLRCIRRTSGMPDLRQTNCTTLTASRRSLACCCQRKASGVFARARRKRVPLLPHRIEAQKPPQTLRSTAEAL